MKDSPLQNVKAASPGGDVMAVLRARATRLVALGRGPLTVQAQRNLARNLARVRSTGRLGLAGLGMLVLALVCIWTIVMPQHDDLARLQAELTDVRSRSGGDMARPASPSRKASEFIRQLPTRGELPAVVGVILKQAEAAGISLESGTYEWRAGKAGGPGQYRISLPVQGTYPKIRGFVEATLAAAPAVALESLHLARDDVADTVVEAEIEFVVFVGGS